MMEKKIKAMGKDAMMIGITGIGISAMSGVDTTGTSMALAKGLKPIASVSMMGHTMGLLQEIKIKKGK